MSEIVEILNGMVRVHDIDDEIEMDRYGYGRELWLKYWILWIWCWQEYGEYCMTLLFYVPSRDDNCRLANRQLFVLMILFGLIRPRIIGQLIERKWPTVVWQWRAQPFPFCNGNRIGVPSLEIAREGNCPLIMERDTVSNHIVKM